MKILVADDDPVSCRLMQRMLQRSGYEVVVASDGRAASAELSSVTGPKLALVDWMMPELDGLGVCQEVRSRPDGTYVYILLLTSKESHEDIVAGLEAGADDYLTKPCHPAELNARLLTGRRVLKLEERLVEAREEMRFRATYDGLTKLLNRASILSRVHHCLAEYERDATPFSILLCDIDHFKRINDVHGHPVGDAVLEQVADRLRRAVREDDWVGRYGGEEFLVVLNGCEGDALRNRADGIRQAISATPFETSAGPLAVSASFGAFAAAPSMLSCASALCCESIIAATDLALYSAKHSGRDCVKFAQDHENHEKLVQPLALLDHAQQLSLTTHGQAHNSNITAWE